MTQNKELIDYVHGLSTFEILKNIYSGYGHEYIYIKELHDRGGNINAVEISIDGLLKRLANEIDNK